MDSRAPSPLNASEIASIRAAIEDERARAAARVSALERDLADIVASSEASPPDDEHDPEGATIGFERAQVSALLDQGRAHLDELDRAESSLRRGDYGICNGCGRAIGVERLLARPAAVSCVDCARRS
jgi:RNA polymerase-binding transcription factor DksA